MIGILVKVRIKPDTDQSIINLWRFQLERMFIIQSLCGPVDKLCDLDETARLDLTSLLSRRG